MTRRSASWLLVALLIVVAAAGLAQRHVATRRAELAERAERHIGSALFHGKLSLPGHLVAHTERLPTLGTRCSNCHEATSSATAGSSVWTAGSPAPAASGTYARILDTAWLTQPQARRGGPPSVYDAAALCAALRSGVDPAHVVIPTAMPRYDASDAECRALWAYLAASSPDAREEAHRLAAERQPRGPAPGRVDR